jgi:hypothetical protein
MTNGNQYNQNGISSEFSSGFYVWRVISDKVQIRRIIDLLGDSAAEESLRHNLITRVLDDSNLTGLSDADIKQTSEGVRDSIDKIESREDQLEVSNQQKSEENEEVVEEFLNGNEEVDDPNELEEGIVTEEVNDIDDEDDSQFEEKPKVKSNRILAKSKAKASVKASNNEGMNIKLLTDKGVDVPSECVIKEEVVSLNTSDIIMEEGQEGVIINHKEYFDFAKK